MVEPNRVTDDIGRKSVTLVGIHHRIIDQRELTCQYRVNASYFTRVLRLAYLAPDIVKAIVSGRQPTELTANRLVRMHELPIDWPSQRQYLGFPTV